jgi:GntR family transcriptional regulator, rspAB operon transcriptional repressor
MSTLSRLEARTLTEKAAMTLRESILAGNFSHGERLILARIAQQLGVNRGTVRGALKKLRTEGLVRHKARQGTFVR